LSYGAVLQGQGDPEGLARVVDVGAHAVRAPCSATSCAVMARPPRVGRFGGAQGGRRGWRSWTANARTSPVWRDDVRMGRVLGGVTNAVSRAPRSVGSSATARAGAVASCVVPGAGTLRSRRRRGRGRSRRPSGGGTGGGVEQAPGGETRTVADEAPTPRQDLVEFLVRAVDDNVLSVGEARMLAQPGDRSQGRGTRRRPRGVVQRTAQTPQPGRAPPAQCRRLRTRTLLKLDHGHRLPHIYTRSHAAPQARPPTLHELVSCGKPALTG
jgi:hypothetical protein